MFYSNINKKVKDFFEDKNYNLNRALKFEIKADKLKWSLENKLLPDGAVERELKATNEIDLDTFTLTASSKNNPKFEWNSKRLADYFDLSTTVNLKDKEKSLEIEAKKPLSKFNIATKTKYEWEKHKCILTVDTTYVGIENLAVGVSGKVEREANNNMNYLYDIGFQYEKSKDQIFSLATENCLASVKAGTVLKSDKNAFYGQVGYTLAGQATSWAVGLQRSISEASLITFVMRDNLSTSLLYNLTFPKNNVNAQVCWNSGYKKNPQNLNGPPERDSSIEYRVTVSL